MTLFFDHHLAAGANNGGLTLWIDGVQQADITGIDNDTRRVDRVQLGPLSGIDAATSGTYYFDAFESRRTSYIGPLALAPSLAQNPPLPSGEGRVREQAHFANYHPQPQQQSGAFSATFTYDGDGKRVKSTMNGVTTYFVGAHFELTGSTATKYYYAGSQRIALRTGSWDFTNPVTGTLSFMLGDHLGSTSLTTNASGQVISEIRYKAWGETRYAAGVMPSKYQYTGQFSYEPEFGLYFYNARWYDSALGRFAQADSIIPKQTQGVQAWDRYAYTNNNPVRYTDPTGHGVDCGMGDPGCKGGKMDPKIQLFEYNHWLIGQVRNKKMNDLEAFSRLVDRAASLTPNCTQCFVNNLGAILTGHSRGNSALNELADLFQLANKDPLYITGRDYQLDQSGFDSIFQDPYIDEGGNPQPHHYWFFVQVGYESGGFVGYTGVLAHETFISSTLRGMSAQDQYLGYEGVDLGVNLAAGTINISEVGDYIRRTLSPGSENAEMWRYIHERNVRTAP